MKFRIAAICLFVMAFGAGAGPARADTASFTISVGNAAVTGTGPYATVTVNRIDTTHATITFDSLTNGGFTYLLGDGGSVGANINATTFALGTITGSNSFSGFTPGPYSSGGAANEDGFGSFNQTIDTFDGFTNSSSEIVIALVNSSGTWANASSVLKPNSNGLELAVHVFACAVTCNTAEGALFTGFASTPAPTPEPGTLVLFGSGLLGVAGILRRRFSR